MARARKPISELIKVYDGLSPAARQAVCALLAFEIVLIAVTERDIQLRSPDGIRGPKLIWRAVATQNVVSPAAYFCLGRRGSR